MIDVILRPPGDDDWPAILDLAHRSLSELPDAPPQEDWLRNRRAFPQQTGKQHHLVAVAGDQVVGYAAAEQRRGAAEGEYRLFIVVAPADRATLGRMLFEQLREFLLGANQRRGWMLEYVADSDFLSFLEELGFVRVESFNLTDSSPVVRLILDAPFRPGVTPAWHGRTTTGIGDRFTSRRMAENYRFRPPHPPEVYETLLSLFGDRPRILLDAGCGPGKITLGLIDGIARADAVDPSREMLRVARALRKGDSPKIRWILSTMEDATLKPPYGLVVAALSIHWMDLGRVMPKFAAALAPGGFLALVNGDAPVDAPWEKEYRRLMLDFLEKIEGTRPSGWKSARDQLGAPLLIHPQYHPVGDKVTAPFRVSQNITDFLRCEHSRASWSEDHLGEALTGEFDAAVKKLLSRYAKNGILEFDVRTRIEWGRVSG
jgi:SAM-dependent methyltransferase